MGVTGPWDRCPIASFDSHAAGAEHPALDGVVLIGDAAGHVDPAFGCGLSLALRDVRVLVDHLRANEDHAAAAHAYARERVQYYRSLLRLEGWMTQLLYATGLEADALRVRAMPRLADLGVDIIGAGPDNRSDEDTRRALFS